MFKHVHHVHYVVENRAAMIDYLDKNFGMKPAHVVDSEDGKQKDVIYEVGETHIQITEPVDPNCTSGKFLAKHGPGVLHVAWAVDNIQQAAKDLAAKGNKIRGNKEGLTDSPRGYLTVNIDQSSSQGLWLQIAEGAHVIESK
jgi:methylmalonyl-CoA/ethylmalonyl-CoA epimerase